MTPSEAAEALADTHDEMPGLFALAEGWPAVIGLAALVPYPTQGSASDVPETLHRYFAEELYEAVSPREQWSAVRLSLCPTIDEGVARSLFGDRAATVLEEAYAGGFLTKNVSGFEMHPLVRQFLHTKVTDFEPRTVRTEATTIAMAYAEQSLWDEAVAVAAEFGLVDVTLRVLTDALDGLLSEGRLATLIGLARRFAIYLADRAHRAVGGNRDRLSPWRLAGGARQGPPARPRDRPR